MLSLLLIPTLLSQGTLAVIELHGTLGQDISLSDIRDRVEGLDYDAILLDIDSPGGTSVDSHELVRWVRSQDVPVVALVRNSATSGAYWVAASADYVVADELSLVGGMGAMMNFLSFEGLASRYGISSEVLAYPGNKSAGSPFRSLSPGERAYFENMTLSAGEYFRSSLEELRPRALAYFDGYPHLAKDAPGLVDEYGGFDAAVAAAERLSGRKLKPTTIRKRGFPGILGLLPDLRSVSYNLLYFT